MKNKKILLGIGIGIAIVIMIWIVSLLADRNGWGASNEIITVEIEQGSGVSTITDKLKEQDVIKHPIYYRLYLKKENVSGKLQYGTFELKNNLSYQEITNILMEYAKPDSVRITFPEGMSSYQIAEKMEKVGLCTAEEFLEVANEGDFSQYEFWKKIPSKEEQPNRFMKCEGYLYPDTYEFLVDGEVYDYVDTFYGQFEEKMTNEIYEEMINQNMTLDELITLSSFVQEEAGNKQNSNVATVFRNRLKNGSPYPKLESNVCSYINNKDDNNYLCDTVAEYYGGWNNIPKNIVTAYDTYHMEGLPPGPISNPGIKAIEETLNPTADEDVLDCYFFVTDLKGKYYYGKTLSEHQNNCEKAWAVNRSMK